MFCRQLGFERKIDKGEGMDSQANGVKDRVSTGLCPHCGKQHLRSSAYCPNSGKPLSKGWWSVSARRVNGIDGFCADCGKALPNGATICPYCGKEVARTSENQRNDDAQATGAKDAGTSGGFPFVPVGFRAVLIAGICILPWFDVMPLYGAGSFNLFSISNAFSNLATIGQSLANLAGATSSVPATLQFAAMICFAFGAAPTIVLVKEIYDAVKRRGVGKIGYVATLCIAFASAIVMVACNAAVDEELSKIIGISGQEYLSLSAGWVIVVLVSGAALFFDREEKQVAEFNVPKIEHASSVSMRSGYQKRRCTECNTELEDEAKFCPVCGKPVSEMALPPIKRCPRCRALVLEDYKFCPICHKEL